MKKFTILAASLFATSLISACGQTALNMPGSFQPHRNIAPELQAQSLMGINKEIDQQVKAAFKSKDANGDGAITPEEFPVKTPLDFQKFRELDSSKDGRITTKEMAPGLFGRVKDIFRLKATAAFLFDNLDSDSNNQLTKEEISGATMAGLADNFDKYLTKPLFAKEKRKYLRKTDFENLVAFIMLNPAAPASQAPDPAPAPPAEAGK